MNLIIFIVLKKRPGPDPETTIISIVISDSSSDSDVFTEKSESFTEIVSTSTIPKTDSSKTIPTIIIDPSDFYPSNDSI